MDARELHMCSVVEMPTFITIITFSIIFQHIFGKLEMCNFN